MKTQMVPFLKLKFGFVFFGARNWDNSREGQVPQKFNIKMLESRPEDALVKLVKTVEIVETACTAHFSRTAHSARTAHSVCTAHSTRTAHSARTAYSACTAHPACNDHFHLVRYS